jgi:hypothetical protein
LMLHCSLSPFFRQSKIAETWEVITDNTSSKILLNSSKQPQEPD